MSTILEQPETLTLRQRKRNLQALLRLSDVFQEAFDELGIRSQGDLDALVENVRQNAHENRLLKSLSQEKSNVRSA